VNFGTDIALQNFDIVLTYGDFELVKDENCFFQQLKHALETPKGAYFYDPDFGSRIYQFLHASMDNYTLIDFEIAIREVLETQPLILQDSIEIKVSYENESLKASVYFETIDDSPYNLVIETGKEISIWEEK